MSAIALAVGICTSCQKEREPSPTPGASGDQVTVIATISDAGTKVSYSEEGTNLNQSWSVGDRIVGWDAAGNAIELEIADEDKITDGTAIFTPVTGSAPIPTSGNVYMIYAPGKHYTDVSEKSLTYDLDSQDENSVPALMTATGSVSDNVLELNFTNRLAIVAVKNPTFPVTAATTITGLQLSGDNILTTATFSEDGSGGLQMSSSEPGEITKVCNFTTDTDGSSETMVYFAVLPNTAANVTVSTTAPTGYQISFPSKSFTAGKCYMLNQKDINKQTFTVTVADDITNGTITTYPTSGSSVAWGETVTVTAEPSEGYELATLTYNGTDIKTDKSFIMPQSAVTVSGTFQKKDYAITADGTPTSGTYTVTGGTYTIKKGSDDVTTAQMDDVITVTPDPAVGYSGGTVTVKKTGTDEDVTFDATNKTFTMPAADVTITVSFTHDEYNITSSVTPTSSGTVKFKKSDSEVTKAHYEEEITVEATPAAGYELVSITAKDADGASVTVSADGKFTMPAKNVTVTATFEEALTGTINGHNYVKIGGKKWATMNIGASSETDAGTYFAWGDVTGQTRSGSAWSGGGFSSAPNIGDPATLPSEYDAAKANWGSSWRMPTEDDFVALAANGVWYWTANYNSTGVKGYIVYVAKNDDDKGKANMNGTWKKWNGSSSYTDASAATETYDVTDPHIFFPAAGYGYGGRLDDAGSNGSYWSSTLFSYGTDSAYYLSFNSGDVYLWAIEGRCKGFSVRPLSD